MDRNSSQDHNQTIRARASHLVNRQGDVRGEFSIDDGDEQPGLHLYDIAGTPRISAELLSSGPAEFPAVTLFDVRGNERLTLMLDAKTGAAEVHVTGEDGKARQLPLDVLLDPQAGAPASASVVDVVRTRKLEIVGREGQRLAVLEAGQSTDHKDLDEARLLFYNSHGAPMMGLDVVEGPDGTYSAIFMNNPRSGLGSFDLRTNSITGAAELEVSDSGDVADLSRLIKLLLATKPVARDEVRCKRLVIVGAEGQDRAILGTGKSEQGAGAPAVLMLLDEKGKVPVILSASAAGDGAELEIEIPDAYLHMGVSGNGAYVSSSDEDGDVSNALSTALAFEPGVSEDGKVIPAVLPEVRTRRLVVVDHKDRTRFEVDSNEDPDSVASMALYDAEGHIRVGGLASSSNGSLAAGIMAPDETGGSVEISADNGGAAVRTWDTEGEIQPEVIETLAALRQQPAPVAPPTPWNVPALPQSARFRLEDGLLVVHWAGLERPALNQPLVEEAGTEPQLCLDLCRHGHQLGQVADWAREQIASWRAKWDAAPEGPAAPASAPAEASGTVGELLQPKTLKNRNGRKASAKR